MESQVRRLIGFIMKTTPAVLIVLLTGCGSSPSGNTTTPAGNSPVDSLTKEFRIVADIPPPTGFKRVVADSGSFGYWLRSIPLKKDKTVYLYDGSLKHPQGVQYVVMDIPVGNRDLQQCADAVMRIRADYLFAVKRYTDIRFRDNAGKLYAWSGTNNRTAFDKYLVNVFAWCGSASLEKQLKAVPGNYQVNPGDVLIKGGFPGHAMIVVDVVINNKGQRKFMLAQSYMPAQDIHIVKNPADPDEGPWYDMDKTTGDIITPEWTFNWNQLRTW
jgi:hypothetical protein